MKSFIIFYAFLFFIPSFFIFSSPDKDASPEGYQSWTAEQKINFLWHQGLNTPYDRLPRLNGDGWIGLLKGLKALATLNKTFDHESDFLPEGRKKVLHPWGSV